LSAPARSLASLRQALTSRTRAAARSARAFSSCARARGQAVNEGGALMRI